MIQSPNSTAMLQLYYIKATIISTILKNYNEDYIECSLNYLD